jgi:Holliday junction resolvase RusA-like endonuclease
MVKELLIICPTFIMLPLKTKKDKKVSINLNTYRNLHFLVESKCKKAFKEDVRSQIEGVEIQAPIEVTYKVYKASARRLDKMNVVSICSKYIMDALSELGCIEDDNDEVVKKEIILPTEIDRENPRIEVYIKTC